MKEVLEGMGDALPPPRSPVTPAALVAARLDPHPAAPWAGYSVDFPVTSCALRTCCDLLGLTGLARQKIDSFAGRVFFVELDWVQPWVSARVPREA